MYNAGLLKQGFTTLLDSEKRVIDTNELVARRLEALADKMERSENRDFMSGSADEDGSLSGLSAETVEGLLADDGEEGGEPRSNVIKGGESREIIAKAREEAEHIFEQTLARAQAESDKLREETMEALAAERDEVIAQARDQGYSEGLAQAKQELEAERLRLQEQLRRTEAEYQQNLDEIEPQLIDAITGIYEHIFHVELEPYRDILVHLIADTMRKVEGSRDFLVHVSKEDYPYVSMQKKQVMEWAASPNSSVEIIEDITLSKNQCMIETEGGIFDCGLGTQLAELRQKLRLLSYEK